jgi:hypothetical protein
LSEISICRCSTDVHTINKQFVNKQLLAKVTVRVRARIWVKVRVRARVRVSVKVMVRVMVKIRVRARDSTYLKCYWLKRIVKNVLKRF